MITIRQIQARFNPVLNQHNSRASAELRFSKSKSVVRHPELSPDIVRDVLKYMDENRAQGPFVIKAKPVTGQTAAKDDTRKPDLGAIFPELAILEAQNTFQRLEGEGYLERTVEPLTIRSTFQLTAKGREYLKTLG